LGGYFDCDVHVARAVHFRLQHAAKEDHGTDLAEVVAVTVDAVNPGVGRKYSVSAPEAVVSIAWKQTAGQF